MADTPLVGAIALGLALALAASAPVPGEPIAEDPPPESSYAAGTTDEEGTPDEAEGAGRPADADQPAEAIPEDDRKGDPPSGPDDETGSAGEDSTPGVSFRNDGSVSGFQIGGSFAGWGLDLGGMQTEEGDWSELVERSDALRDAAEEPADEPAEASRNPEGSLQDAGDEGAPDSENAEGEPDPGSTDG